MPLKEVKTYGRQQLSLVVAQLENPTVGQEQFKPNENDRRDGIWSTLYEYEHDEELRNNLSKLESYLFPYSSMGVDGLPKEIKGIEIGIGLGADQFLILSQEGRFFILSIGKGETGSPDLETYSHEAFYTNNQSYIKMTDERFFGERGIFGAPGLNEFMLRDEIEHSLNDFADRVTQFSVFKS